MRRLSTERLREIAKLGANASVSQRRTRRELARAQAARLTAEPDLAQFSPKDRERLIYHANEIERILVLSRREALCLTT